MAISLANTTAKSLADDLDSLFTAGSILRIYSGSLPADADASAGGNTILATLLFGSPAFGAASDAAPGGLITANSITDDSSADATGTATFFRCFNGATPPVVILQGSAGVAGTPIEDLELTGTATITSGLAVSITSMTLTMPES